MFKISRFFYYILNRTSFVSPCEFLILIFLGQTYQIFDQVDVVGSKVWVKNWDDVDRNIIFFFHKEFITVVLVIMSLLISSWNLAFFKMSFSFKFWDPWNFQQEVQLFMCFFISFDQRFIDLGEVSDEGHLILTFHQSSNITDVKPYYHFQIVLNII